MAEDCYADLPNLAQVEKENLQLKNNKVQVEKDTEMCCVCGIHCFRMYSNVQHWIGKAQGWVLSSLPFCDFASSYLCSQYILRLLSDHIIDLHWQRREWSLLACPLSSLPNEKNLSTGLPVYFSFIFYWSELMVHLFFQLGQWNRVMFGVYQSGYTPCSAVTQGRENILKIAWEGRMGKWILEIQSIVAIPTCFETEIKYCMSVHFELHSVVQMRWMKMAMLLS